MAEISKPFWQTKSLSEMSREEWESLCDRCGRCCLIKLEDEDSGLIFYTDVACKLLDGETGQCCDYQNRHQIVPECTDLSLERISRFRWLPKSCAYRRLAEGKTLENWHPLCSGTQATVVSADISMAGKTISEDVVPTEDLQEYVIHWFE